MRGADDVAAADFAAIAVLPDQRGRVMTMVQHQAGDGIDRRTVVAREHDRFTQVGEDKAPGILRLMLGAIKAPECQASWPQAPDACLLESGDAPRRFDVGTNVQSLRHPQFAAGAEKE